MKGFILGLANGTVCLAYCAPVLVPYLLGTGKNVRQNYRELTFFLTGRLLGYLLFAILAWAANLLLPSSSAHRELILGVSYLILAGFLVVFGFKNTKTVCAAEVLKKRLSRYTWGNPVFLPGVLGLLTGLNLCPPFLLAFTEAAATGSLWQSIWFFLTFFMGTSLYFVPIPVIGFLKRVDALRVIGRLAAGVIGVYYFYYGLLRLIGAIGKL